MGMTGFDVGFDIHFFMKLHSISPLGDPISFACSKAIGERIPARGIHNLAICYTREGHLHSP